jgi:tryptophan-rich sensory protein
MLAGLKWGAIVGVAVYVVALAFDVLAIWLTGSGPATINDRPALLIPVCGVIFAILFACSAAGFYVARETGVVGHAAFAGVVVLVVQYVLGQIYSPVARNPATHAPVTAVGVIATLIAGLLVIGIAACMGWLGGRPGAQQHARRHSAMDTTPPEE